MEGHSAVPPLAEALCGPQSVQTGQPLQCMDSILHTWPPKPRLCPLSLGGCRGCPGPTPRVTGERGRAGWSKLATPRKGRTGDTQEPRSQPAALGVAWAREPTP